MEYDKNSPRASCPPRIPYEFVWHRTQVSAVGHQRLNGCAREVPRVEYLTPWSIPWLFWFITKQIIRLQSQIRTGHHCFQLNVRDTVKKHREIKNKSSKLQTVVRHVQYAGCNHPLCYRYARYSWLCVVPTLDGIPNTCLERAWLCSSSNSVHLCSESAQVKQILVGLQL